MITIIAICCTIAAGVILIAFMVNKPNGNKGLGEDKEKNATMFTGSSFNRPIPLVEDKEQQEKNNSIARIEKELILLRQGKARCEQDYEDYLSSGLLGLADREKSNITKYTNRISLAVMQIKELRYGIYDAPMSSLPSRPESNQVVPQRNTGYPPVIGEETELWPGTDKVK